MFIACKHKFLQRKNFLEAAKIYQALFETIEERMDEVDDSNGYYADEFSDYLKAFLDCITKAGLGIEAERKLTDYISDKYTQKDLDYFRDDYGEALKRLKENRKAQD